MSRVSQLRVVGSVVTQEDGINCVLTLEVGATGTLRRTGERAQARSAGADRPELPTVAITPGDNIDKSR